MKTKLYFAILIAVTFFSCSPTQGEFIPDSPTGKIMGTLVVINGSYDVSGKDTTFFDYINNNVEAELTKLPDETNKYNIKLLKVCFSNHMPVTIDMTIPNVDIDERGNISGDNIVPYAGILGEYPKYTIYNLTGKVVFNASGQAGALMFNMTCGEWLTSYEGMYVTSQ